MPAGENGGAVADLSISGILEESIRLELNVADLYLLFFELFPDDSPFWWKLTLEEKNHAALIKSLREIYEVEDGIPLSLFPGSIEDIRNSSRNVEKLISQYKKTPPSREEAFRTALSIEESAGELHYQDFMVKNPDKKVSEVFRRLNGEDRNHALRILHYMDGNGIPVE